MNYIHSMNISLEYVDGTTHSFCLCKLLTQCLGLLLESHIRLMQRKQPRSDVFRKVFA